MRAPVNRISVETGTGETVAAVLTTKEMDDGAQTGALLDQVAGPVASFTVPSGLLPSDRLWSGECDGLLLSGLQDAQHHHAPAQELHAALEGRDVLVAAGTRAKKVAEFIVPSAEPGG